MLRAYENDKPANTPNYLQINFAGPSADQLVFVAGDPGSTRAPANACPARIRARHVAAHHADARIGAARPLHSVRHDQSSRRAHRARRRSTACRMASRYAASSSTRCNDDALLAAKSAGGGEAARSAPSCPEPDPWREIEAASTRERALYLPYTFIENGAGFNSALFRDARLLVRGADERAKPNNERLREFTEASLPLIERDLYARVPVYPEFETIDAVFLPRAHARMARPRSIRWFARLLTKESPDALATRLDRRNQARRCPMLRKQLWEGGKAAVDASLDPMIELVRARSTPMPAPSASSTRMKSRRRSRPRRKELPQLASRCTAPISIRTPRFTLRLNYGTVQGWVENGTPVEPFTHLDRAFERATGASPFKIPDSWMKVKAQLNMRTPFCISTSNDIVGGNSGSPLIDASGKNRRPDV